MITNRQRQRGFTMIEMIGVLAVIAILASIVAPKIFDAIRDAKVNTFASNIQAVKTAVASYYKDVGALPSSASALIAQPSSVTGWKGPYLDKQVSDLFASLPTTGTVVLTKQATTVRGYNINGGTVNSYAGKTSVLSLGFPKMDPADGKALSISIDNDGTTTWYKSGQIVQDTYAAADPGTTATDVYAFIAAF